MDPRLILSLVLVFLASCGLFLVCLGGISLLSVPNKQKQIKETDSILRKRVFQDEKKVRIELNNYFVSLIAHLTKAEVCFFFAFIILSLTFKAVFSTSIFEAMLVTGIPAFVVALIGMFMKKEVKQLQWSCLDKLREG